MWDSRIIWSYWLNYQFRPGGSVHVDKVPANALNANARFTGNSRFHTHMITHKFGRVLPINIFVSNCHYWSHIHIILTITITITYSHFIRIHIPSKTFQIRIFIQTRCGHFNKPQSFQSSRYYFKIIKMTKYSILFNRSYTNRKWIVHIQNRIFDS